MDADRVASEWIRALRGKRSQVALGKRLGYASNILYRWEAGECFPAASVFFRLARICGANFSQAVLQFLRHPPPSPAIAQLSSAVGVAAFLDYARGGASISTLAASTGFSRHQVSRWLSGKTQPTLPVFLTLLNAVSGRSLDFVAAFVDPANLQSLRQPWSALVAARETAYAMPWSAAVLGLLTTRAYRMRAHSDEWVAEELGLPVRLVTATLKALSDSGQVRKVANHYVESAPDLVDTRADPQRARDVKAWWLRTSLERLEAGAPGLFAYNVSAISKADLKRIEQLQRQTYREMSRIIAESREPECVIVYGAQLLRLDGKAT